MESELEGDIDLRGFFGLAGVPKGYTAIRVKFIVKTDPQNIEKLRALASLSPVYNTLINGTKVDIQVEPKK
ncbi:OsmC family peroxiredoxin [Candidatus Brocadia pituitae]|nr:OsmC family peroxiredoxin [Candidatus Brocadia pituitae]